jgi:hypothetical protein
VRNQKIVGEVVGVRIGKEVLSLDEYRRLLRHPDDESMESTKRRLVAWHLREIARLVENMPVEVGSPLWEFLERFQESEV